MSFLGVFAGAALPIASTGLYGVISYSVSQRSREIALRIALADRRGVLPTVMRQGMVQATIGIILGIAAAAAVVRLLQPLLFQTSATDVVTYAGISILLHL
jgi:ABC-type antimicrobial peptide transport system permease subunit